MTGVTVGVTAQARPADGAPTALAGTVGATTPDAVAAVVPAWGAVGGRQPRGWGPPLPLFPLLFFPRFALSTTSTLWQRR